MDSPTNSLSMLAQSLYAHGELQGKKWPDLQEMCWKKGRNWNDLETAEKRGVCVYKQDVVVNGKCGPITRRKFVIDHEIPIFHSPDAQEWWRKALGAPYG